MMNIGAGVIRVLLNGVMDGGWMERVSVRG